ncbi:MAG: histidine phosphatase family protein [Lachnospiraceae bacterium]|nr:histidine phosphatase family protein [Lachnospiraceae bacterium]
MRLLFIRHGEPDYKNDCLTETGRQQALIAAGRLQEEGIEEIWSSPLGRAYETAEATSGLLGIPIRKLECMKEVRWGSTDGTELYHGGHPWDIVDRMAEEGTDLTGKDWRESPYFRTNRVLECVDQVEKGIDEWLEGLHYVREGFYYRHVAEEAKHRTIALFCHGGSSSAAIGHILNLPFPYVCAMLHMEFTGITILRFDRKEGSATLPCLELGNDGRHIATGRYHRLENK